jgi:hypothetical protein
MPACKEMVKIVLGSEAASEISTIPLSAATISRRVIDMSSDIEAIMKAKINSSQKFSLLVANSEHLPINIQEEVADLKADRTLKLKLLEVPLVGNTRLFPRWQLMCYCHFELYICVNWASRSYIKEGAAQIHR